LSSKVKGRRRAISTSKMRKITAIRKNRSEKGKRDELLGSNPHSKGDLFSRSEVSFLDSKEANPITKKVINIRITAMMVIRYNTHSEVQPFWLEAKYTIILNEWSNYLTSKWRYIRTIIPHLQNVNIRQQLQTQNGDLGKSVRSSVVPNMLLRK
jgi:hypothetical protein